MVGDGSQIILTAIDKYPWHCSYQPKAEAELTYFKDEGFRVRMRCYEKNPRSVNCELDSPVYQDSCLECFLNFYPEDGQKYLNFEVNSNGAMLCQAGEGKQGRVFIRSLNLVQPQVTVWKEDDFWEISYEIPLSLIQSIYGKSEFQTGHRLRGNFYKCGDLTQTPHFGCWSEIDYPTPNFHLPEFFGEMMISMV